VARTTPPHPSKKRPRPSKSGPSRPRNGPRKNGQPSQSSPCQPQRAIQHLSQLLRIRAGPSASPISPPAHLLSHPRDSTINQTRRENPPAAPNQKEQMIISPIPEALTFDDVLLVPSSARMLLPPST